MNQKPDVDIAAILAAAGFGTSGVAGSTIIVGEPLPPEAAPNVKLFVWAQGGPAPEAIMQRADDGHLVAHWDATVFVRIRDVAGGQWAASRDLACQVLQALTFPAAAGYWDIWPDTSYPEYLGPNAAGQFEWQVVVSAKWTA